MLEREEEAQWNPPRPMAASATYSALCEQYGVKKIPAGWDAVDMAKASAKFGTTLPAEIEKIIVKGQPTPRSLYAGIVEKAKRASGITDDELRTHYSKKDAAE